MEKDREDSKRGWERERGEHHSRMRTEDYFQLLSKYCFTLQ